MDFILKDPNLGAYLAKTTTGLCFPCLEAEFDRLEFVTEFNRGTAWLGEPGLNYRYTGRDHIAKDLSAFEMLSNLTDLARRNAIEMGFNPKELPLFNHLLINRYIGSQKLAMHKDDEPELIGPIASLSIGASAPFYYGDQSVEVSQGDFLIGNRNFFTKLKHGVGSPTPARVESCGYDEETSGPIYPYARYNLTWRTIAPDPWPPELIQVQRDRDQAKWADCMPLELL